jgi:ATP-dependent RNA helicase RhlE
MEPLDFKDLVRSESLLTAVRELGWTEPTPIQVKAIPTISEGRDVVGIAQTGTGKTGAFLLPALERMEGGEGLRMLILCPTRELAQQVAHDARQLASQAGLWVVEVVGGMPMGPQIRDLKAHPDLLVATPGRLIDHIGRGNVHLSSIETLVLDEADRMLDMGFRPQIEEILRTVPTKRQTLMFSATMPNGVHALALRILKDPLWVSVSPERMAAETVEQVVYPVRPDKKGDLIIELLEREGMDQVLVFTRTKIGADSLGTKLERAGVSVGVMHGDRNMKQRMKALEAFDEGHIRVLVATDVAQRGLDIEGISHVINYDVPQDPEDYVHRIGRTGRAGAKGDAITLMTGGDLALVRSIEQTLGYVLPRVSLPDYDYPHGGGAATQERSPVARTNRTGNRVGSRSASELSEEQLKALLKVGTT